MGPKRRYAAVDPELQRAVAAEYRPGERGAGAKSLASKHGLPLGTVQSILDRAAEHGDPVTPHGHKKRKLDAKQEAKLTRALDRNPLATNRELARTVGDVIVPQTVSRYLARADPPFTRKKIQDQEPEELTADWKEEARRWLRRVKDIALDRRVYADESAIYENEALTYGRSRKGKPIFRPRPRWAKRYTLHVYAKRSGVVYWELSRVNANTSEIERVAAWAADYLSEGDVVIWDRLGRSGRSVNPVAQHYSPVARSLFVGAGLTLEFLPPKGKYFNPIELLFSDLKNHYIRPAYPGNGEKLSFDTLHSIIEQYMNEHAAAALPGFFRDRANGKSSFVNKLI
jgi:transposase